MQIQDPVLAQSLAAPDASALPARLSPSLLRSLANGATYAGGEREAQPVIAPFTGETVGTVLSATPEDVHHAVERARRAQPAWADRPVAERAAVLKRYHDLILDRQLEAMDLIQLEGGKCRFDAYGEVADITLVSRYYAYHGPDVLRSERRSGLVPLLSDVRVRRVPRGVVGIIAPWNFPLTMALSDAIPALMAGNAVVLKPAEETPYTALWAARLLYEAGLPPEVFHVVLGRGEDLGEPLVDAVDYVHFTGSTAVGRIIGEQAGAGLKGCSLELGGKNPLVVRADVDLDRALDGIRQACFVGAGQTCVAAERIYVHESRFDEFVERFAAHLETLEINARYDFSAHLGSLASQQQLDKVSAHVEDAVAKGATVVTGGHALPHLGPFFYAPTVLTGATPEMDLYREETFGPVVAVYPFATDAEAVTLANDSAFGLNASVWTRDTRTGRRIAAQIECGTVGINDGLFAAWGATDAPMGGFKQSGLGRRHGREGILEYTEAQTLALQHGAPIVPSSLGLSAQQFTDVLTQALQIVRHLPGLR